MVSESERSREIRNAIERALDNSRNSEYEQVTTRECSSNRFNGVQVNVYGGFVPVQPIIDLATEKDSIAIEDLYHCTDSEEPHLGIFFAYLPEQSNPAFV